MPYSEFIDKRIFKPLGMTHTRLDTAANETPQAVTGYINADGKLVAAPWGGINWPFAAGALRTNIDDLAIWGKAITGRRLLKPESWILMTTSHRLPDGKPTGYAYGLAVGNDDEGAYIRHSGEIDGFSASELMYPERGIFIAVLENVDPYDPPAQEMSKQIAALLSKSN
jgi:CubicO group peptidase (beta-lactamase class C family)